MTPQPVRRFFLSVPFFCFLFCLLLMFILTACSPDRRGLKPPIRRDVIEFSAAGMKVIVTDFKWQYVRSGTGLEVTGKVKNRSGRPQEPVVLYAMLFDETGLAVGMGDVTVSPRRLEEGGVGTFSLVVGAGRQQKPSPIKHIRLLTNAQNR